MKNGEEKIIKKMIEKGMRALKSAKEHIKKRDYDFAASKAYYGVFHHLQAILYLKGLTFSKHSAVISEFNRNFIKSGVFSKEFSKDIERLFKERQIGDYDYFFEINKKQAEEDTRIAEKICNKIEEYIIKEIKS